jgi:hypothetical protein
MLLKNVRLKNVFFKRVLIEYVFTPGPACG